MTSSMKVALTKRSAGTGVRSLHSHSVHGVTVGFRVPTGGANSLNEKNHLTRQRTDNENLRPLGHVRIRCSETRKLIEEFACKWVSGKRDWDRQTGNRRV